MKKHIYIFIFLLCYSNLFSQNSLPNSNKLSFNEKLNIQGEDDDLLRQAICNPLYRVIKDTLNSDSIVQILYPNGQMYYQFFYSDGLISRGKEEFYPNGQLKYSGNDDDSVRYTEQFFRINYDRFGDTMQVEQYIHFKGAVFQVQKEYVLFENEINYLHFYWGNEQLYKQNRGFVISFFCTSDSMKYFYETYQSLHYRWYKSLLKKYLKKNLSPEKYKKIIIKTNIQKTPFLEGRKIILRY